MANRILLCVVAITLVGVPALLVVAIIFRGADEAAPAVSKSNATAINAQRHRLEGDGIGVSKDAVLKFIQKFEVGETSVDFTHLTTFHGSDEEYGGDVWMFKDFKNELLMAVSDDRDGNVDRVVLFINIDDFAGVGIDDPGSVIAKQYAALSLCVQRLAFLMIYSREMGDQDDPETMQRCEREASRIYDFYNRRLGMALLHPEAQYRLVIDGIAYVADRGEPVHDSDSGTLGFKVEEMKLPMTEDRRIGDDEYLFIKKSQLQDLEERQQRGDKPARRSKPERMKAAFVELYVGQSISGINQVLETHGLAKEATADSGTFQAYHIRPEGDNSPSFIYITVEDGKLAYKQHLKF